MFRIPLWLPFLFVFFVAFDTPLFATSLSGEVTDAESGESIVGAGVYLTSASDTTNQIVTGRSTTSFGLFSLNAVEPGEYYLRARSIGYESVAKLVSIGSRDTVINIQMSQSDVVTDEVTVRAERTEQETIEKISTVEIKPSFVKRMPAFAGEVDIFRVLQLLPGISSANELFSGLYVRGGSPDQNLILLDGVIVYNPSHLGGIFSTFNNDAIRDIKMIKGAFPAEYGGRLSSVLDMTMKEGAKDELHGAGGISLIASRLTLEGPITEDISFMVSGRRTYFDLILNEYTTGEEDFPTYYFYDFNAKTNWRIDENNHLFLSGYFGSDVFEFDEGNSGEENSSSIGFNWGNSTANLRWLHIVNSELFMNFSAIYTDYGFYTDFSQDDGGISAQFETMSQIRDFMLRANAEYFPHPDHDIKVGVESIFHNFRINAAQSSDITDDEFLNLFDERNEIAVENSLYIQDKWQVTDNFTTNIGTRFYYFNQGNYFFAEPRISAAYNLGGGLNLKAAGTVGHQFLHLVVRNDIALPTDLWFASNETIKPQRAYQGVLGIEQTFNNNEYLVSVEGFYKHMENLLEFREDVDFTLGVPKDTDLAVGQGEAYGLEFFLNKQLGDFTGWIGYTLSWTQRQFDDLNRGQPFFPRYDRRHDVSVTLNYSFNESWEIGAAWVYATGQAYTMPQGSYYFNEDLSGNSYTNQKYDYTQRNGARLDGYHRLDLNLMWKHKIFDDNDGWLSFNIYNAYDRRNPFFQYIGNDDNTGERVVKQVTLFPVIPTIAYNFEF